MDHHVRSDCRSLIEALDAAITGASTLDEITHSVRDTLSELILAGACTLPEDLRRPAADSYARRLIYACPHGRWTALAMIWGPGQGTPLHDHAGLWCVEGVLEGQIEVTQYRLLEQSGTMLRFEAQGTELAGVGSAGRLIPPYDYHTIANAEPGGSSITIHVYGGDMDHCNIFEPRQHGWYETVPRTLKLTA